MLHEVYNFNQVLLGIRRLAPKRLDPAEARWLDMALQEELDELRASNSIEEDVDALIDLIYFAIGGLVRLGLSELQARKAFLAIHRVNMMKKAGVKPTRPQNGDVADAIKPDGLSDPLASLREILK